MEIEAARVSGPDLSRFAALRLLRRDPIRLLEAAAATGDVSLVRVPRFDVYVVNHPDLVWEVLATGAYDFVKGPTMRAAKRVLGESLLTTEGERHRRQRRLLQPIFHRERIDGYADSMSELADREADRWRPGEVLDLHREMARLTLAIVGRTLFDTDVEAADAGEVASALTEVLAQFDRVFSPFLPITERLPLPSSRRFNAAKETFERTVGRMIEARRGGGATGDDLLSVLIRTQDGGAAMTDAEVRDEAVTLFLAGHETTSNALTWTWYLLSRHPEVEARFHAELDEMLGDRLPAAEDVPRLRYTEMVLAESMRMFPPAWAIGRRVLADHDVGGSTIPAGSVLVVSPWLLHHDARWFPHPWRFDPGRFADEATASRPRHAYLPFGGGPRMCIGEGFARTEAVLVLATLGRRLRFEHVSGHEVELQPVITLRPRFGMRMRAITRSGR